MRIAVLHNPVTTQSSAADQDVLVQVQVVSEALAQLGHQAIALPVTLDLASAAHQVRRTEPDVVFNLVESLAGSDWLSGLVPALLANLGMPYTGSPIEACILSADKLLAKKWLAMAGLPTPAWLAPDRVGGPLRVHPTEAPAFPPAWILKSVTEHASFGLDEDCVFRGLTREELVERLERHAAKLGRTCFAEAYIEGREFNLSVLAGPDGQQVLSPAEIDFSAFPAGKPRVVGQRAKWEQGSFEFENTPRRFDFPAEDRPLLAELNRLAVAAWDLFHLGGYARVDFRVDASGRPWILEVNSNPCLSPDAGLAAALTQTGISFPEAVRRIVEDAIRRGPPGTAARVAAQGEAKTGPTPAAKSPSDAGITYRYEVTPADRDHVRRMVESSGFFSPAEVGVAVELVDERLAKGEASGYFFIFAEQDDQVLGYSCYGPIAATADSFDLYWIAVDNTFRSKGLGRLLMTESERRIAAVGGRNVYVETSNRPQYVPTRSFYERFGYHRLAVFDDFYGPGDDKVVYVKRVGQ
jgi:D-alanine-D-alanine ligase-like ATP-grasp enzyme/ribosomal protein S18 acetylase RimI-like enzyme